MLFKNTKNKSFNSTFKVPSNQDRELLLELFSRSGINIQNINILSKDTSRNFSLSILSNKNVLLMKIDKILLHWRHFYLFLISFFNLFKRNKAQLYFKIIRTIPF